MKLWIARNKSGTLVLWFKKPVKLGYEWYNNDGYFILDSVQSPTFGEATPFPEVTFENSPQEVEIKLVNNTTNGFAEDLLINCIPLEGEFSKFVDDNFEHLI